MLVCSPQHDDVHLLVKAAFAALRTARQWGALNKPGVAGDEILLNFRKFAGLLRKRRYSSVTEALSVRWT